MPDPAPARDRILTAAEELFAEHGYHPTSCARLARAAGVPQGLIFYHFGTKEGLLLGLVRERAAVTLSELVPPGPVPDLRTAVAELWQRLCDQLGAPTRMRRLVLREMDTHEELREYTRQFERDTIEQVARYLAGAAGHAAPGQAHRTAARLLTVTASVASMTHGDEGRDLAPDIVAALLVDGLPG